MACEVVLVIALSPPPSPSSSSPPDVATTAATTDARAGAAAAARRRERARAAAAALLADPRGAAVHSVWICWHPAPTNAVLAHDDGAWEHVGTRGVGRREAPSPRPPSPRAPSPRAPPTRWHPLLPHAVSPLDAPAGGAPPRGGAPAGDPAPPRPPMPPVVLSPSAFAQANASAAAAAVGAVRAALPDPASVVLDLFSGVGTLGLSLEASRPGSRGWVECVERSGGARDAFAASAALAGGRRARLRVRAAGASLGALLADGAEVPGAGAGVPWTAVIVDPPRRGLGDDVLAALADDPAVRASPRSPRRLLYLSCGVRALAGDLDRLLAGGWTIDDARGFVFFPGADHVETLVELSRLS